MSADGLVAGGEDPAEMACVQPDLPTQIAPFGGQQGYRMPWPAHSAAPTLRHADKRSAHFAGMVDAWLASSPSPTLAQLIATTGLSSRQIERRCRALFGASPKLLARRARALRAAAALNRDCESMADTVGRGFYDQSHMIREIKYFTGMTPGQLRSRGASPTRDAGPPSR